MGNRALYAFLFVCLLPSIVLVIAYFVKAIGEVIEQEQDGKNRYGRKD